MVDCVGHNVFNVVVFFSGGRKILVTGSGFDQVQKATMVVTPSSDEIDSKSHIVEVGETTIFMLPFLNKSRMLLIVCASCFSFDEISM